jgi:hypothetical protein
MQQQDPEALQGISWKVQMQECQFFFKKLAKCQKKFQFYPTSMNR